MIDASITRLRGRWTASAAHPGQYEKTVMVKGVSQPVKLIGQLLPNQPLTKQFHCIAYAGNTLRGEGYAHRQAYAAHRAIHNMLGLLPAE
jgi:hypothetical protein